MGRICSRLVSFTAALALAGCSWFNASGPDDEVSNLLGKQMTAILMAPDSVNLEVKKGPGGFGNPIVVEPSSAEWESVQDLVYSWQSYVPQIQKKCRFRPSASFSITKNGEPLELSLDRKCKIWRFVSGGKTVFEDFDPVADELEQLLQKIVRSSEK